MIREATKYDKTEIIELLKLFRKESNVNQFQEFTNDEYSFCLISSIIAGRGIIYLEEGKGLIVGLITPSVWNNRVLVLHELAWYVKPEFRHTSVGYKLLRYYINYGERLKDEGRINYFTLTKMKSSPDLKYEKFGFAKIEENWIR